MSDEEFHHAAGLSADDAAEHSGGHRSDSIESLTDLIDSMDRSAFLRALAQRGDWTGDRAEHARAFAAASVEDG